MCRLLCVNCQDSSDLFDVSRNKCLFRLKSKRTGFILQVQNKPQVISLKVNHPNIIPKVVYSQKFILYGIEKIFLPFHSQLLQFTVESLTTF